MSMLPAATSCSSGFQRCVRLRSTSVTCARPRRAKRSPSRVTSSSPPAPPPTTTMRCGALAMSGLRVQGLQHGGEELSVGGDDAAALEVLLGAFEVAHEAARLAHEEGARGHVPGRETHL